MDEKKKYFDDLFSDQWRKLGFYYDMDFRVSVNQWRFYGSRVGLGNFVKLLDAYVNDPANDKVSEHSHYEPYLQLKIMTWDFAMISESAVIGTIEELKKLREIIANNLINVKPGQTFSIDKDYGVENAATAKFFVMADDFDPASMDELIMSNCQEFVNKAFNKGSS